MLIMLQYFIFIVKKRMAFYRKLEIPQPLRSKVFIVWISIVIFLTAFDMAFFHVMSIFVPGTHSPFVDQMIYYMRYINFPIFQFVSASTITYIFYYQAMELKREAAERQGDIIGALKQEEMVTDDSDDVEANLNSVTGLVNKSNYLSASRDNNIGNSHLQ